MKFYPASVPGFIFLLPLVLICGSCKTSEPAVTVAPREPLPLSEPLLHLYSDDEVNKMLAAPNAGSLVFSNGSFGHVDWDQVHAAPSSLKRITFKSSILDQEVAAWLEKQNSVERISIVGCTHFDYILRSPVLEGRVLGLSLFDLCLNEDDVRLIEKFSQLSGLGLEESHMSDQQVINIAGMKSLRILGIHGIPISRQAILKIREAHPTLILDADD